MPTQDQPAPSPYQTPSPQLQWGDDGAPFSREFADIYFSRDDGLAETDYVFLQQNRLAERWSALDPQRAGVFVIAETGFGTGLNFFSAWRLWQTTAPQSWRLHFISVEKFPLRRAQLQRALQQWPQFSDLSAQLLAAYPALVPGQHLLKLGDHVALQLLFDDAVPALDGLHDSGAAELTDGFSVDAWFLDGFAPAKNPAMWSADLFAHIGRLSKPGTSFATFTVAGAVKRGLRDVGFDIEKLAGFGSKREMLRGDFGAAQIMQNTRPHLIPLSMAKTKYRAIDYWAYPPILPSTSPSARTAIVIGGGLAGTSSARALAERGWSVTLLEKNAALASEASGNPSGVLYTKLSPQAGTLNRFALASYLYALRFYRQLVTNREMPNADIASGELCGVLQLADDIAQWQALRETFSGHDDWVQFVEPARASELAGCTIERAALWFPQAGWLAPRKVCEAAAQHAAIDTRLNCRAESIERNAQQWRVQTDRGELQAAVVVIANANAARQLLPATTLPLKSIRGQITQLPAAWLRQQPKTVICHAGYLAPTAAGLDIGATFDLHDDEAALRPLDHRRNVQLLAAALPQLLAVPNAEQACDERSYYDERSYDQYSYDQHSYEKLAGRVGFRCTTPDYLPLVGPVADSAAMAERCAALAHNANARLPQPGAYLPGLYVNVGHGSRGLTSTPLCAELLASLIAGTPRPLPRDLVQALSAARFGVRDIIRGRAAAVRLAPATD